MTGSLNMKTRLTLRSDISTKWAELNPVLLRGEIGIELDNNRFKIGNGLDPWNNLQYTGGGAPIENVTDPTIQNTGYEIGQLWVNSQQNKVWVLTADKPAPVWKRVVTEEDILSFGPGDMKKSDYAMQASQMHKDFYVDKAIMADSWTQPINVSLGDDAETKSDVLGSMQMDGTKNVNMVATLANVTPETVTPEATDAFTKFKIDSKGRVIGTGQLGFIDMPHDVQVTLNHVQDIDNQFIQFKEEYKEFINQVPQLGTGAGFDVGTNEGNIPQLGPGGKLPDCVIPDLAMTSVTIVNTVEEMTKLTDIQVGDLCIVKAADKNGVSRTFIYRFIPNDNRYDWTEISTDYTSGYLTNLANKESHKVFEEDWAKKTTTDLPEGDNLYFTEQRVQDFMTKNSFTLNGGNARSVFE